MKLSGISGLSLGLILYRSFFTKIRSRLNLFSLNQVSVTRKNRVNKDCLNQTISHERRRLRRIYPRSLNETCSGGFLEQPGLMREAMPLRTSYILIRHVFETLDSQMLNRYFSLSSHRRQLDTSNKGFPYFNGLIVCQHGRREVAAGRNDFGKEEKKRNIPSVFPMELH